MSEQPSNTSNNQRLKEMMCHLTPCGVVIPYTLCIDLHKNIWVASKGGLFKFDKNGEKILFKLKNDFPKKIAPYCQVFNFKDKIIYIQTEDKSNLTEFKILNFDGEIQKECFLDGKIQSFTINNKGDMFLTKQPLPNSDESIIYKTSIDYFNGWEELCSSFDFSFQSICIYDDEILAVATVSFPINIYSKQSIKWIDTNSGEILGSFSLNGKENGQIYFPRCIKRYQNNLLVMDKTGRFQQFSREGKFVEISAKIDSYLGNGFILRDDEAIVACSGIVLNELFESVSDKLKKVYKQKLYPLEEYYNFHEFHSPALDDPDFNAKPMILLVGQYSTGKTTFIRYLLERDFPGCRIGPEPTTDRFIAIMEGDEEGIVPGNALVVDSSKQFRALTKFGNAFLNRFQCSTLKNEVLKSVTIIDTPGILSGEKQRIDRGYDFSGVLEWFAERVDRIILLFDAHKLDISDEFKRCIEALSGNEDKIRIVLNKSDMVDHQQLMRVYGALMWSLGKVFKTPEVSRVYIGTFWDEKLHNDTNRRLFEDEKHDLFADLQSLPRNAALRKLNDLIKRARLAKVHAYIIAELRKQMPSMIGKEKKKKDLIQKLDKIFESLQKEHNISPGDFPDVNKMREHLQIADFTKFNAIKPRLLEVVDNMLSSDIASLMSQISKEEATVSQDERNETVRGGAFDTETDASTPFGFGKGEGVDKGSNEKEWIVSRVKSSYDDQFSQLPSIDGKISGATAKAHMLKSKLPNSVLAKIWLLADVDNDGQLDMDEFALANYLIGLKLEGHSLPEVLPAHLIPPSKKSDLKIENDSTSLNSNEKLYPPLE